MTLRTAVIFATSVMSAATALAADAPKAPETPAGYVRTGESENCLRSSRIDSMKIINSEQILVEMRNGETYLQQPRSCSPLRKTYALSYSSIAGEICDTTGITLLDGGATLDFAGVCIFDQFQKLEKQTAKAD